MSKPKRSQFGWRAQLSGAGHWEVDLPLAVCQRRLAALDERAPRITMTVTAAGDGVQLFDLREKTGWRTIQVTGYLKKIDAVTTLLNAKISEVLPLVTYFLPLGIMALLVLFAATRGARFLTIGVLTGLPLALLFTIVWLLARAAAYRRIWLLIDSALRADDAHER